MAIGYNSSSTGNVTAASSLTYSHTTAGTDRFLVVDIHLRNVGSTVSGVTYAGVAMTQLTSVTDALSNVTYTYYLLNPTSGANNVVISTSGGTTTYSTATSYTGVKQVSPIDSSNTGANTGGFNSIAIATTVVSAGCWVHGFACAENATGLVTWATNRTDRGILTATDFAIRAADSNAIVAAGSQSTTWTRSVTGGSATLSGIVFSFKPTEAGGAFLLNMI